ncbi:MAG: PDDEXK-like family protein, partial [Methylophagaceae bacterium]
MILNNKISKPNIFHALRTTRYEIRHSNFLAWLMSPEETHGLSNIFLHRILDSKMFPNYEGKGETFKVYTERDNMDLCLLSEESVLVIENKIGTKDHSNQLFRYREKIGKEYPDREAHFTYLTPSGELPTDRSEEPFWSSVSYESIVHILQDLLSIEDCNSNTKVYIEDYIESLNLYPLSGSVYQKKAESLVQRHGVFSKLAHRDVDIRELIGAEASRTISYIISSQKIIQGNGFFRKGGEYYTIFSDAIENISCVVDRTGSKQSTYISFTNKELHRLESTDLKIPFRFNIRAYPEKNMFILAAVIVPASKNGLVVRELLLNNRNKIHTALDVPPVSSKGKYHVTVYRRKFEFDPYEQNIEELRAMVRHIFEDLARSDIEIISGVICELIK